MRRLTRREIVLLVCPAVVLAVIGADTAYRWWSPTVTEQTAHYTIRSTAPADETRRAGIVAEMVHAACRRLCDRLDLPVRHDGTLAMKLFRDRAEFRRCNRVSGWAEAFYREPSCYFYLSTRVPHPYH